MEISIIIVNWNTKTICKNCLHSIYNYTKIEKLEIVVVDNASTDGSQTMIRECFPEVKLIALSYNSGFSKANNIGINSAKYNNILLLNSDTVFIEDSVSRILNFMKTKPDAGVTGCRILNPDLTNQVSCFTFPGLLNLFLLVTFLSRLFPKSTICGREEFSWWDYNDSRKVDGLKGCFMCIRKDVINSVGLLDENFFFYGEDMDWCYRMLKKGYKNYFCADTKIIHISRASSDQHSDRFLFLLRKSKLDFIKKHRTPWYYYSCYFLTMVYFFTRYLSNRLKKCLFHSNCRETDTKARIYKDCFFKMIL